MAFYIFPPKGRLSLEKLELYTRKRLELLIKLAGCHGNPVALQDVLLSSATVESSDCLIEGSTKDAVSHFALRLVCATDPEMASFFQQAESTLFFCRMSCMNKEELMDALKPMKKYHETLENVSELNEHHKEMATFLDHLTELMDWETIVNCYMENTNHSVMLPWHYVPYLVAKRVVNLHKGYAIVECTKLPDILGAIFGKMLHNGLILARRRMVQTMQDDDRMSNLTQKLKDVYYARFRGAPHTNEYVRHEQVDELSQFFPPCMKNLHQQLRSRHRLGHHNRIAYTLFLKEVGLPVNEATQFWRQEYSQSTKEGSPCKHSWQNDAKRYAYSIRHLYGLEGNRVNYKAHRCQTIQSNSPSLLESGGCPFKHFDKENLTKLLRSESISDVAMETILSLATDGDWSFACLELYREKKRCISSQTESAKLNDCQRSTKREHPMILSSSASDALEPRDEHILAFAASSHHILNDESGTATKEKRRKRLNDLFSDSNCNNCDQRICCSKTDEKDNSKLVRESRIANQTFSTDIWESGIEASLRSVSPVKRRKLTTEQSRCLSDISHNGTIDSCATFSSDSDTKWNITEKREVACAVASQEISYVTTVQADFEAEEAASENISANEEHAQSDASNNATKITDPNGAYDTKLRKILFDGSSFQIEGDITLSTRIDTSERSQFFHKPIDFYRSYKALVEGLSC